MGTFVEVFVVLPGEGNVKITSLGITYQLAGVFLTGMLAGKNAAAAAQIAYVIMGLFKLPIFYLGEVSTISNTLVSAISSVLFLGLGCVVFL